MCYICIFMFLNVYVWQVQNRQRRNDKNGKLIVVKLFGGYKVEKDIRKDKVNG